MKMKLIIAGIATLLIIWGVEFVANLIAENATQKQALDKLAATVQFQEEERRKTAALSIEKMEENQRLTTELGKVKHELGELRGSKEYQLCKEADLPDGYNDRIRRLRDQARRRERVP